MSAARCSRDVRISGIETIADGSLLRPVAHALRYRHRTADTVGSFAVRCDPGSSSMGSRAPAVSACILARAARGRHERSRLERRFRRPSERRAGFRQSNIRPVGVHAQEPHLHERIQDWLAHPRLDPAEPLYLFDREPHSGHFQILGAKTLEHPLIEEHIHGSTRRSRDRAIRRTTQLAFGVQPVINVVPNLATAFAVHLEDTPGDIALGHI